MPVPNSPCPDQDVCPLQGPGRWFTQRPPGQEKTIAPRPVDIQQHDIEIPEKAAMLKSVIKDQDIGAEALHGSLTREITVRSGKDGNSREASGNEHRFISPLFVTQQQRGTIAHDIDRRGPFTSVPPTEYRRTIAVPLEHPCQQDDQGGFPRPAHGDIPYADHPAGKPHGFVEFPIIEAVAKDDAETIKKGEGFEQKGKRASSLTRLRILPELTTPFTKIHRDSTRLNSKGLPDKGEEAARSCEG